MEPKGFNEMRQPTILNELTQDRPCDRAPGVAVARDAGRIACGLGAAAWTGLFAWLWLGAPALGRVLGLAWFALGIFSPGAFLYSLALAFPWFGHDPGGVHQHPLYLLDMGLMGLVAGHLAARARGAVAARRSPLDRWVFLFTAYSCATVVILWQWYEAQFDFDARGFLFFIMNLDGTVMLFGVQLAIKLALGAGLFVHLRDCPWPAERQKRLWGVMLGALALTALAGWLDYTHLVSLKWWRGENVTLEARFGWARLQALYGHSGWLAQYIEALGPGMVAFALAARGRGARVACWLGAALLAATQCFTMARAGWIGLAGGCTIVIAAATLANADDPARLRRLAWRLGMLGALALLMAAALALVSHDFRHRVGTLFAWQDRSSIWKSAVSMFEWAPVFGVTLGNYNNAVRTFFPHGHPYWAADNITAHNLYLHIAVERGLIGLGLYLGLFGLAVRRLWQGLRGAAGAERTLRLALLGGLAALALDGFFQYIFYIRVIEILFWLFLGFSAALDTEAPPRGRGFWRRAWLGWGVTVALLCWHYGDVFQPYKLSYVGRQFYVAGARVALPVPEGARRLRLVLTSMMPDVLGPQPEAIVRMGTRELARVGLKKEGEVREVEVALPARRDLAEPLIIEASHTWSPWRFGMRYTPFNEVGILYQKPVRVE